MAKAVAIGIVTTQALRVDTKLRAQFVGRLISEVAIELQQTATAGIERRACRAGECTLRFRYVFVAITRSDCGFLRRGILQSRWTDSRILVAVAEVEIDVTPTLRYLSVDLNLLAEVRAAVKRQVLLRRRTFSALAEESATRTRLILWKDLSRDPTDRRV